MNPHGQPRFALRRRAPPSLRLTGRVLALAVVLLPGCRRDPVLLGFWEIVGLEVAPPEGPADEIDDVGTFEFSTESVAVFMLRCAWEEDRLVPAPPTGPWTVPSDASGADDAFSAYAKKGDRFTVTLGDFVYDIEEWSIHRVVLRSDAALPPPQWERGALDTGGSGDFGVAWTLVR